MSDDLFFSHRPQISNFPLFLLFQYISSWFREIYNFPLLFYTNSPAFYILHVYLVSPYFYHDAVMHHPIHVLDASVALSAILISAKSLKTLRCPLPQVWSMTAIILRAS